VYENKPEVRLILQEMDINTTTDQSRTSGTRLVNPTQVPLPYNNNVPDGDTFKAPGNGYYWYMNESFPISDIIIEQEQTAKSEVQNFVLVNGQYEPKITVDQGKWYRFRMVMSSTQDGIMFTAPAGCDLELLGHDGIYLYDAPRTVEAIVIPPGGRADVAIRCDIAPGIYPMELLTKGRNYGVAYEPDATAFPNLNKYNQTVGQVTNFPIVALLDVVQGSVPADSPTLPSLSGLTKPCYLADLSQVPQPTQFWLNYGRSVAIPVITGGKEPVCDNNANFGLCVNGVGFNESVYTNTYMMGVPQETYLVNNGNHPHHQHVNPMQLHLHNMTIEKLETNLTGRMIDINNYDMDGDWYDTLQIPGYKGDYQAALARWVASDYNTINETSLIMEGKIKPESSQIFHCHILSHEDQGMAGQDILIGEEGDYWEGATNCMTMNEPLVPMPPTPAPTPPPKKGTKKTKHGKNGPPPKTGPPPPPPGPPPPGPQPSF
jgi:FtsP/CotA-like multicopper oxidase with cupredoxin domain